MKKAYNEELYRDVIDLLMKKDTLGHRERFEAVMEKHGISRTTLYKELAKDSPGEYREMDPSSRRIAITPEETSHVRRLIFEGRSTADICKAMTAEMGFSYTPLRLGKAKTVIIKETDPESSSGINSSTAEANLRKFLYMLSGIDVSDPERIIALRMRGIRYRFPVKLIKELLDILALTAIEPDSESADMNSLAKLTIKREILRRSRYIHNYSAIDLSRLDKIRRKVMEEKPKAASKTGNEEHNKMNAEKTMPLPLITDSKSRSINTGNS